MRWPLPDRLSQQVVPPLGATLPTQSDAARRFAALWGPGRRPEIQAFLAQAGDLSPAERMEVLRIDQFERWQRGERVLAEEYLQQKPTCEPTADRSGGNGVSPTPHHYAERLWAPTAAAPS